MESIHAVHVKVQVISANFSSASTFNLTTGLVADSLHCVLLGVTKSMMELFLFISQMLLGQAVITNFNLQKWKIKIFTKNISSNKSLFPMKKGFSLLVLHWKDTCTRDSATIKN